MQESRSRSRDVAGQTLVNKEHFSLLSLCPDGALH